MPEMPEMPESAEPHYTPSALRATPYIAHGTNRGMGVLVEWGKVRKFVMGANSYNLC